MVIPTRKSSSCGPNKGVLLIITHLDGVFALREVLLALLRLLQLSRGVLGGQATTDGTSLLGAEIEGQVLLVLVEQAHVVSLLGVDDGEDTGDRLAEVVAIKMHRSQVSICSFFPFIWPIASPAFLGVWFLKSG